ncbi:MAG: acyltransferase [Actinobacteria bacterium]|nr:acyltransferase [Actinomycetota bacterium]
MSIRRWLVEAPPSARWTVGRIATAALYRSSFESLGRGTVIVAPRILRGVERISIGADCSIYEDAWLQAEPGGRITIGDHVNLSPTVHVHALDPISIGDRCVVGSGALIISARHAYDDRHAIEGTGPIVIGDDVFLGERATILGGVRIGDGATVAAATVVTKDVPAGAIVAGVPGQPLHPEAV